MQSAERYLKEFEKHQAIVKKYENNPFLKGKILVSKSTKQEYKSAVIARYRYKNYMEEEGITGKADFKKQIDQLGKMKAKLPEFKGQIQFQEKAFGLLDTVLKGIEQAGREMTRKQQRQKQPAKLKKKSKNRKQVWERDGR